MRTFRSWPVDVGDVLESAATGARWVIQAVRPVKRRTTGPDADGYTHTYVCEVERIPPDGGPADARVWPFERSPRR